MGKKKIHTKPSFTKKAVFIPQVYTNSFTNLFVEQISKLRKHQTIQIKKYIIFVFSYYKGNNYKFNNNQKTLPASTPIYELPYKNIHHCRRINNETKLNNNEQSFNRRIYLIMANIIKMLFLSSLITKFYYNSY